MNLLFHRTIDSRVCAFQRLSRLHFQVDVCRMCVDVVVISSGHDGCLFLASPVHPTENGVYRLFSNSSNRPVWAHVDVWMLRFDGHLTDDDHAYTPTLTALSPASTCWARPEMGVSAMGSRLPLFDSSVVLAQRW